MNLEQRRAELLKYVLGRMTEVEFDRDEIMGFRTYQEFANHQRDAISQFDEGSIGTMEFLRDRIVPMSELMDKDNMVTWRTSRYCFSKNNKIVFFHER